MTTGLLPGEFLELVIRPTLRTLAVAEPHIASPAAEKLLLGTAMVESKLRNMRQAKGPALSLFQIEPPTFDDVLDWTARNNRLSDAVDSLAFRQWPMREQYAGNQFLACAVARLLYWRRPERLPGPDDVPGLAAYWKQHYNTRIGKGKASTWEAVFNADCAVCFA